MNFHFLLAKENVPRIFLRINVMEYTLQHEVARSINKNVICCLLEKGIQTIRSERPANLLGFVMRLYRISTSFYHRTKQVRSEFEMVIPVKTLPLSL